MWRSAAIGTVLAGMLAGCGHAQSHDVGSGCTTIKTAGLAKRLSAAGLQFSVLHTIQSTDGQVAEIVTFRPADAAVTGFLDLGVFETCAGAQRFAKQLRPAPPAHKLLYANVAGIYEAETPRGVKTADHLGDIAKAFHSAGR